jgi:hypothetical protein
MVESIKRASHRLAQRLSPSWRRTLVAYFGLRILSSLWFWLIQVMGLTQAVSGPPALQGVQIVTTGFRGFFIDVWLRWDSVHYLRIAQPGYAGDVRSGFFPLYPLLGRAVGWLFGGDAWIGLLIVSNLAALLSFYLLDRWLVTLGREKQAPMALAWMALFPTGFFLIAGYPHSLLLLLVMLGVWSAGRRRWAFAFMSGLAAGLTHSTALPLSILFIFWPSPRRTLGRFLAALGPPLGVGLFLSWRIASGYPGFSELLRSIWGRQWIAPWTALIQAQEHLGWPVLLLRSWPNILVAAAAIVAIYWAAKNLPLQHAVYQGGLVLLLFATGTQFEFLAGFSRYALSGYPLFAALPAFFGSARRRLLAIIFSGAIQLYLAGLFVLWAFIG